MTRVLKASENLLVSSRLGSRRVVPRPGSQGTCRKAFRATSGCRARDIQSTYRTAFRATSGGASGYVPFVAAAGRRHATPDRTVREREMLVVASGHRDGTGARKKAPEGAKTKNDTQNHHQVLYRLAEKRTHPNVTNPRVTDLSHKSAHDAT